MIVDAHAHLGLDEVFDEDFTEADLVDGQRANDIDASLVQPGTCHGLAGVQRQHDAIAETAARHPGHVFGIANPNPHLADAEYEAEVRRCIERLHFVGLKIHPFAHAVNPLGRHGRRAFALAAGLDIPVIVHTGAGIPWAAPSLLAPVAEAHPDLRIVVAHAGGGILAAEAGLLAGRCGNTYLECSWTAGFTIRRWVQTFGPRRILFGSDHAENAAAELANFRAAGLTREELDWTLGRAAATVFRLPLDGLCSA